MKLLCGIYVTADIFETSILKFLQEVRYAAHMVPVIFAIPFFKKQSQKHASKRL
jgi:hypothetical protein